MADRFVMLRDDRRAFLHLTAPNDDTSTLCGEPADDLVAIEIGMDMLVVACGACMKVATG